MMASPDPVKASAHPDRIKKTPKPMNMYPTNSGGGVAVWAGPAIGNRPFTIMTPMMTWKIGRQAPKAPRPATM